MILRKRVISASIAAWSLFALPSAVSASPYLLTANPNAEGFSQGLTDQLKFSVSFEDTGDHLLQKTEITRFSFAGDTFYTEAYVVPEIDGISTASTSFGLCSFNIYWCITPKGGGGFREIAPYLFDYVLTPQQTNNIPEPSSLALLSLGLAGIAAVRKRKV